MALDEETREDWIGKKLEAIKKRQKGIPWLNNPDGTCRKATCQNRTDGGEEAKEYFRECIGNYEAKQTYPNRR